MRVLVAGAFGLVGPHLTASFERRGWSVITLSRRAGSLTVDLGQMDAEAALAGLAVDAVVNCVALTDVDACERSPHDAWRNNAAAVAELVRAVPAACHFVQISTDQVYGERPGPHPEGNVSPVNVYGRTKLAGDMAALGHPISTVLRTNVFGPSLVAHRSSLSDWISHRLASGQRVDGFQDLVFSPVHLATLADVTAYVLSERISGTFNVGSWEPLSKFDFARAVGRQHGLRDDLVEPALSTGVPGRAPRPADTSLDGSNFQRITGIRLPTLMEEIERL